MNAEHDPTGASGGRRYSALDRLLIELDQALEASLGNPRAAASAHPDEDVPEPDLGPAERREAARLMRVNHTGEVTAQALYQGQSWLSREPRVYERLRRAGAEEHDHLAWCGRRISELGGRPSLLNPVFYAGSLGLGALAGALGDRWSLGFVAETENQVIGHIDRHLGRLPEPDTRSRAILDRMQADEARHGEDARRAGGASLPRPARALMAVMSKVMTTTTYYV